MRSIVDSELYWGSFEVIKAEKEIHPRIKPENSRTFFSRKSNVIKLRNASFAV
jgi:hypothetical protein